VSGHIHASLPLGIKGWWAQNQSERFGEEKKNLVRLSQKNPKDIQPINHNP
jgi:hypothetical protein